MSKRLISTIVTIVMILCLIPSFPVQAVATLKIGDYVQMGSYYGEPILWRCVDIDENGPLILADKILTIKPYDAGGNNTANNSSHGRTYDNGSSRKSYGSDYWADSNMRSWLNSTATAGNVAWLCGNPPTNDKVQDGYAGEKGFLADGNFAVSERNAIKTVTQKSLLNSWEYTYPTQNSNYHINNNSISSVVQNYATAYSEQVTDKMFLLDVKQVNRVYENRATLGTNYYIGQPTQKAVDNSEYKNSTYLRVGKNWSYWLRSPFPLNYIGTSVRFVTLDGNVGNNYAYNKYLGIGVRPAFYINLSSAIFTSGTGAVGSPYIVSGGSSGNSTATTASKTITVYENKNDMTSSTDNYTVSSGATVNVGGTNYPVNSYGNVTIPTGKDITVSKANYVSQPISASELTNSNKVYLEKSGGNMPIVKGVTLNGKHLRGEGASVSSDGNIKVDIDWNGNTAKTISIKQGTTVIPVNNGQTGNVALGTLLKASGDIFIVAESTNGRITQKKLKLSVISASNTPKIPEGINFGNSVSGQSSDIPLIGKMDFKFEIPKSAMPISFNVDHEKKKIIGTIGFQSKDEILAQEDYDTLKNIYKSQRSNNQSIRDSLKKALGTAKNNKLALPQSVPWGIDMKVFVGGYFEATWDESGNIKYTDTRIEGELSAGVKYNYPFVVLGVPAFLEAYLKGEIGFSGSINGILSTSTAFLPDTKVEGEVAIGASLNAGLSGVLSAGGGGEGALKYTGVFVPLQDSTHKMEVTLKAFIQAQVLLLKWDYTLKKWGPYTVWQNPSGRSMSLMNSSYENIYSSMYDKSNYSIQDRSYINEPSEFVANGNLNTRMNMSMALFGATPSNKIESTIKTNVYPNSMPQLVDLGSGKQLLVWVDDDINRTSTNRTSLYYSLYNGSWSTPQAVHNDGTADFAPQLKIINGTTYLVWQNAKTTFSDTVTLEQMAQNLEIYVAKYNNANNTFDEINNVSNNSYLDMLPTIYGDGSEVSIVWASNTLNDIFGQNTNNQIMKSSLSGNVTTIASGLKSIDSLTAGKKGVDNIIAYSVEMDGDMQTMKDKEIYINKNGTLSRLTTNEIIDSKPYFANDGKLYWYSGGKIIYIDDFSINSVNSILSDETVIPTDRFVVTTNANNDTAIVFEQVNGLKADLHTFIYDKTLNKWSENVALTELNSFINGFSGFIASDGQMKLAFNKQAIIAEMGEENPYGRADLCTLGVSPSYNLSIEGDLFYDPNMLVVGNGLEINTTVKNNGELTVNSVLLEVLDQNDNVLQSTEVAEPIVPGETKEYNAIYIIPQGFNGKSIKVRITPVGSDDFDLLDNTKQISLDSIDASLEDVYLGKTEAGKDVVYAHIVNRGIKDTGEFTLKLVDDTADGTVIATKQVTSLTPLAATVESFEYTNQDVFKTKTLYVVIEDLANESFVGNNSDFVVLERVKALNMTVSNVEVVSQNEDSTGLKLTIDMVKNAVGTLSGEFILAAYTESGKLMSITKAPVSISNTTDTLTPNINVPVKSDENIVFKLFVWNSLGHIEPLTDFAEYLYEPVSSF